MLIKWKGCGGNKGSTSILSPHLVEYGEYNSNVIKSIVLHGNTLSEIEGIFSSLFEGCYILRIQDFKNREM